MGWQVVQVHGLPGLHGFVPLAYPQCAHGVHLARAAYIWLQVHRVLRFPGIVVQQPDRPYDAGKRLEQQDLRSALCSNQVPFALAIAYVMDLDLFFLDTVVVFSVAL